MHQGATPSDFDVPDSHAVCTLHERLANPQHGRLSASETAAGSSSHETVPRLLTERLLERLDTVNLEPKFVLDLGSNSKERQRALQQRYPGATLIGVGWSAVLLARQGMHRSSTGWLNRLARFLPGNKATDAALLSAAPDQLPLADASVDLVVADQLLPWCNRPSAVFAEVLRVLKPGGAFFWSSAGPDTLAEYRKQWRTIDTYAHVWGLRDMHDLGDDMLRSGFSAPVIDRENLTIQYASVSDLITDLRHNSLVNIAAGRRRGLMAPDVNNRLRQAAAPDYVATFELIQGHGWKNTASAETVPGGAAEVYVPVDSIERLAR